MRFTALITAIIAISSPALSFGQNGYNIEVRIKGLNDTIAYLGCYYGEQLTVEDTCNEIDGNSVLFSGKDPLPGGIYFYADQDRKKLFEFIIDKDQQFKLQTDTSGFINSMKTTGTEENALFFEYQRESTEQYEQIKDLQNKKKNTTHPDSLQRINEKINLINAETVDYKINFINDNPDHLLTLVFKMLKEPEIPDSLQGNDRKTRARAYRFYKNNYWSGTDLTDSRIIRTPVFHSKLEKYFEQVISRNPDSIIHEIDFLMAQCQQSPKLFEYLLWHFTATYEQSSIMGHDKIFVHMVDTYFRDKSYEWLSESMYKNIIERADKIKPLLIGKTGPELIMLDTAGSFRSLYEDDHEYLIIFFWTTTCGECKKEIETLMEIRDNSPWDLEIFSVNTDTNLNDWKKQIVKYKMDWINVNGTRSISKDYHILYDIYKTPTIYVLNRKKEIIAKHLTADQIPEFIEKYESLHKKPENN